MKAIADEDLETLKSAARKWLDTTLSTAEHKKLANVLARVEGNDVQHLQPHPSPAPAEPIWNLYGC